MANPFTYKVNQLPGSAPSNGGISNNTYGNQSNSTYNGSYNSYTNAKNPFATPLNLGPSSSISGTRFNIAPPQGMNNNLFTQPVGTGKTNPLFTVQSSRNIGVTQPTLPFNANVPTGATPAYSLTGIPYAAASMQPNNTANSNLQTGIDSALRGSQMETNNGAITTYSDGSTNAPVQGSSLSKFNQQITDYTNQLSNKTARTNEINNQEGVQVKKDALRQIDEQSMALDKSFQTQKDAIYGNGAMTRDAADNAVSELSRQINSQKADYAIQSHVAQGSYQSAVEIANSKVDAEFAPIQTKLDGLKMQIDLAKNDMTDSERMRAENAYSTQQKQVSSLIDAQKNVYDTYLKGLGGDAPDPAILKAIGSSHSVAEAYASIGVTTTTENLKNAIVSQESGGNYSVINKDSGALGKYQIMPFNLGVIGLSNTAENRQKFINSPDLQDQAYSAIINQLSQKYGGNQAQIIAAYYGGGGAANVVGTPAGDKPQKGGYPSINSYVQNVMDKMYSQGSRTTKADSQLYKGLSSPTATAVRGVVSGFKTEPQVTNFIAVQDGYNFSKSIPNKTTNPADDQALIYSLAKVLDPGSVVREGEYATVQKYSQSWLKSYGKSITQAISGTGFLSEVARKNIKTTIETKYTSSKRTLDSVYNSYADQINSLTGRSDGTKFLRTYNTSTNDTTDADPEYVQWLQDNGLGE